MKKNKVKLLAIVLTLVLAIVGCSNTNKNEYSNTVVENNIQESNYIHLTMLYPKTINPILNTDKSVSYIMNLIYDGLFEIDENYNVKNTLVESYSISSDGKSVHVKLLDNATWHNGSNITSSDVDFTIDLIKKNQDSPYYNLVSGIESVKINNSKNFTINIAENDPFIINKLTFPILSKDKLESLKNEQLTESKYNLIGNGPYKIKRYEDRKSIILEPNKEYFGDLPKKRKEIYVKMVPDKEAQTEMVLSLDSDIASITLGELSKFEDKEGKNEFNTTSYQGRNYELVMFNYENDYLKDVNFRKAILASIDREKIIKDAYVDNATISNFPLNTTSIYYDNNVKSIAYNKENAEFYLKKGLLNISKRLDLNKDEPDKDEEDKKSQLILEDNNVNGSSNIQISKSDIKAMLSECKLKIIVSKNNEGRVKIASMIKEDLQALGIKSFIEELSPDDMTKALNSKEYDLAVIGYNLSSVPDSTGILRDLDTKDSKLNKLMDSLSKSTSEENTMKIYSEIQQRVASHASFLSLGVLDNFIVNNKRLEGTIYPNEFDIYNGISNLQMSK